MSANTNTESDSELLVKIEYKCTKCDKKFSNKSTLADHKNKVHPKPVQANCEMDRTDQIETLLLQSQIKINQQETEIQHMHNIIIQKDCYVQHLQVENRKLEEKVMLQENELMELRRQNAAQPDFLCPCEY